MKRHADRLSRIASRVVQSFIVRASGGFTLETDRDWIALQKWLEASYPNEKFSSKERQLGDSIWEKILYAGADIFVRYETRGRDEFSRSEFRVVGDGMGATTEIKKKGFPSLAEMQAAVSEAIANSPGWQNRFMTEGLSPRAQDRLAILIDAAASTVRKALPGADFGSDKKKGDLSSSFEYFAGSWGGPNMTFSVNAKKGSGWINAEAMGKTIISERYNSVDAFAKGLKDIGRMVKDSLRRMDPGEAAALTGRVTPQGVVSAIEKVEPRFDVIDEWVSTELVVTLRLSTSDRVPQAMIEKWAESNWSQVISAVGTKTPPAPQGRGMEHSEPSGRVGFIPPNRVRWDNREHVDWTQSGNKGVLSVMVSSR